MNSRSERRRLLRLARRRELAREFRRLVAWYGLVGEDFANAIQARLTGPRQSLPAATQAEIRELGRQQRRAVQMAAAAGRRADHYEALMRVDELVPA